MKKSFAWVMLIVLIFVSIINLANAEEFILRNGVMFGDTAEALKKKETLPFSHEYTLEGQTYLIFGPGVIAGIDQSYVAYLLDSDEKMVEMLYWLYADYDFYADHRDEHLQKYSVINEALLEKYGDALAHDINKPHARVGAIFTLLRNYYDSLQGVEPEVTHHDVWVIDFKNDQVKIDHVLNEAGRDTGREYLHMVGYSKMTRPSIKDDL